MSASDSLIARGRRVLATESEAVAALEHRLGEDFAEACRLLLACVELRLKHPETGKPLKYTPDPDVGFTATRRPDGGMHIIFANVTRATLAHWRELWMPKLFDRSRLARWESRGSKNINARMKEATLAIIDNHHPQPLAPEIDQAIEAILNS